MSNSAISNAYTRISNEDREYRASLVASLAHNNPTTNDTGAADFTYREIFARASASRRGENLFSSSTYGSIVLARNHNSAASLPSSRSEGESKPTRHNLRPNRPQNFRERGRPLHEVDYTRFHYLHRTRENLQRLSTVPDEDYEPLSRSPTLDPFDRSPSVVSSQPRTTLD